MFSHRPDPPSVVAARATQRVHMRAWVAEAAERRARSGLGSVTADNVGWGATAVQQEQCMCFEWASEATACGAGWSQNFLQFCDCKVTCCMYDALQHAQNKAHAHVPCR